MMNKITEDSNKERTHLLTQKDRHIAEVLLLALIAIMVLYYLYG